MILNTIKIALFGAWTYRLRGRDQPIPKLVMEFFFAYPYTLSTVAHGCPSWLSSIDTAITLLFIATGHGRGQSLKEPFTPGDKPEKVEVIFFLTKLQPYMSVYWYKALILAVIGLGITVPAGVSTHNPLLAISGLLHPVAYMIGWKFFKGYETSVGEVLTGLFLFGAWAVTA